MRVLMFGWEFPPHISGGLGTACEGLTRALAAENVDLLFVVPKLYGDEDTPFTMLNASTVPVKLSDFIVIEEPLVEENPPAESPPIESQSIESVDTPESPTDTPVAGPTPQKELSITIVSDKTSVVRSSFEVIEVISTLVPYNTPIHSSSKWTIETWREERTKVFESISNVSDTIIPLTSSNLPGNGKEKRADPVIPAIVRPESVRTKPPKKRLQKIEKQVTYEFSGRYDNDLIAETLRYAQVASEIGANNNFDVIHAHDWMTFSAGIAAKKASGKKLIVHVHATEFDRSGSSPDPLIYAIEKDGLDMADQIVAVSNWTKSILVNKYKIQPDKVSVVHNGAALKQPITFTKKKFLGSHVVTFLGRLTYQKGPMYFIQAALRVLEKFPEAHFIVAGSGDQYERMIEQVAHLRLISNFSFTGFLKGNDVERLWALSDVYVMPSVSEPFGITPLEAIRAGVPVILSKQSGVSEVMPHAIKVDFWNVEALASAICGVLAYPAVSEALRKNSLKELTNLTWQRAAVRVKAVYEQLVSEEK